MSAYLSDSLPDIPEATHLKYISIGIDDARELRGVLGRCHPGDTIIFSCSSISDEAQDALLKIFEEPGNGLDIYFVYPFPESLLGTLQSRFISLKREGSSKVTLHKLTDKFLDGSGKDRGALVKDLIEAEVDEGEVLTLLTSMEWKLYKDGVINRAKALRATLEAKQRLLSGMTPKVVLNHLAAVL